MHTFVTYKLLTIESIDAAIDVFIVSAETVAFQNNKYFIILNLHSK